jgi:peptide/nickel transport system ATP-binding protein
MVDAPLLSVRGLSLAFHTEEGRTTALRGVSFEVAPGKVLGIVGESGSGKSVTSLSIMRLLPIPPAVIEAGEITFGGRDLLSLREREMRAIRGREIAMIFQEPMSSLNPVHRVGDQIAEAIRAHESLSRREARDRAVALLRKVGIPDPEERARAHPHELSGGMRQRVMIAIALACGPRLLIADEPTTALDVTIQAQILDLLRSLREEFGMSIVLITHDLGVVAELADEIAVMYAGRIVEHAPVRELFERPRHPYTRGLLESLPSYQDNLRRDRLPTIPGVVPDLRELPPGCAFAPRCPLAEAICTTHDPEETVRGAARFRCHVTAREDAA